MGLEAKKGHEPLFAGSFHNDIVLLAARVWTEEDWGVFMSLSRTLTNTKQLFTVFTDSVARSFRGIARSFRGIAGWFSRSKHCEGSF